MDAETLRWIWLVAGVLLLAGEMSTGTFFMLPFALGAFAAAVLAFLGIGIAGQLVVCLVVSAVAFAAFRPIAKKLDQTGQTEGIGALRLVNESGVVLADIPADDAGMVRIGREEWRAVSESGQPIAEGTAVRIVDVEGTRVIVTPLDATVSDGTQID